MIEGRNTVPAGITVAVEILLVALSFELQLRLNFTSSYSIMAVDGLSAVLAERRNRLQYLRRNRCWPEVLNTPNSYFVHNRWFKLYIIDTIN